MVQGLAQLPPAARAFVVAVCAAGVAATAWAGATHPAPPDLRCVGFVLLAVGAGLVRVPMPVVGTFSLAYAFVLATLLGFGLGASTLASVLSAVVAGMVPWRRARALGPRTPFNAGVVGLASTVSGLAYLALGGRVGSVSPLGDLVPLAGYAVTFAGVNTGLIAVVIQLSGDARATRALRANLAWTVPGYVAGTSLAVLLGLMQSAEDLALLLLAAPFAYLVHLAYRAKAEQAEQATRHSQRSADLYRSVTEALALAIEAKDENTEAHLERVQRRCLAVGERIGLAAAEMEALKAAAVLHDIGKIAVPEYILTKPGRLTPEEAEKMMIHPRVGAEILGAVPFPYPLAPIVRHHHERWDGNGYPDRLSGEAIPMGARILSVVDCFDALTSDRPYRKALTAGQALDYLREQSGKMFDPVVVSAFEAQWLADPETAREAPDAPTPAEAPAPRASVYDEISASSRELQALYDIARIVGYRLEIDESLALLSAKIGTVLPFRALVVYLLDADRDRLVARFATGQGADRLKDLAIRVGDKLAGWAALHQRTYAGRAHVNPLDRDGSRSDLEDLVDDAELAALRSAIVAPLSTDRQQIGVIALYHDADHPYTREHQRLLAAVAGHVAQAVRNTLLSGTARSFSLTDPLTGVPNSRFYFLEAGHRIDRAEREGGGFGLVAFRVVNHPEVRDDLGERAAERMLGQVARRAAAGCSAGETLVRFGSNLFLVLTGEAATGALVARSRAFAGELAGADLEVRLGLAVRPRIAAVQAVFPEDGATPDLLLDAVESRLALHTAETRKLLPFPSEAAVNDVV